MRTIIATGLILLMVAGCVQPDGKELPDPNNPPVDNGTIDNQNSTVSPPANSGKPFFTVKVGDRVTVEYTGKLEDGEIFDSSRGREPLVFVAGAGQMIKGFDQGVIGMEINETKEIVIPPKDAYGEHDESKIEGIATSVFEDQNISTEPGTPIFAKGMQGVVVGFKGDNTLRVMVDFNHKLAGKTLIFEVRLLDLKRNV